ncbi:MAG: glutathionylspermidine synthase family protein [Oligoflexia bacterium]|nr:glutathionylspermidine synthase family protein [Oligoflexia bacterium]
MQISTPIYNGQPIPFSLKPIEIPRQVYSSIETSLTDILKQVESFTQKAVKDKKILRSLGLPDVIDGTPSPLGIHIPFARFDFILNENNEPVIIELNTDGTSGWNVVEWVCMQAKIKDTENPNLNLSQRLFEGLKAHSPNTKEIYLIDFNDVMTSWEQDDLCQRWEIKKAEPDQRTWNEGALIYRRAVSWQLRKKAMSSPFVKDWSEKKITVVGGWSSDVGMSKAWPVHLNLKQVAETKFVDNTTEKQLRAEKDLWVVKHKFGHSGRGVTRGCDVDDKSWSELLKNQNEIVVQRRVHLSTIDDERVEYGMFFINGKASGLMVRSGHKGIITDTSADLARPSRIVGD